MIIFSLKYQKLLNRLTAKGSYNEVDVYEIYFFLK